MTAAEKPLKWVASSKRDLMELPMAVKNLFGHALEFAQRGDRHDQIKILQGFGGAGVLEIIADDAHGTYRAVYTVRFEEAIFALHVFQKKSKSGNKTPKSDMDLVRSRLKMAEAIAKEMRDEKTKS